jgi:Protein kinase domain
MKPEHWARIERLYHATLEREPGSRAAFLDDACAGDEDLRRDVASLLAYDGRSASFIEAPVLEVAARELADDSLSEVPTSPSNNSPGVSRIGAYELLDPLGRGGMGEVHLALDTRLQRKVALKLLPARFTTDADRVRRFTQEARAASALNHPNIVTIHEIGEAGSTYYIITEYVEGETLRERMSGAPQKRMKMSEAIDLAVQIAAALSTAHEAGITHRDIKPENVMVRRDGIVKVLDFGLAKLTEPSSPVIGTQAPATPGVSTDVTWFYFNRPPVLTSKDTILLADFENKTGEEIFDRMLKQGLAIQLQQSPFLNLFPEAQIRHELKLMKRQPSERVTAEIAREICERQNLKALIAGSIALLGSHYVITLEAINGQSGETLAREQVEAENKEQVLRALSQATTQLRERLGESLSSIQRFDRPLQEGTTAKPEAFKAYSQAFELAISGRLMESIPFYILAAVPAWSGLSETGARGGSGDGVSEDSRSPWLCAALTVISARASWTRARGGAHGRRGGEP